MHLDQSSCVQKNHFQTSPSSKTFEGDATSLNLLKQLLQPPHPTSGLFPPDLCLCCLCHHEVVTQPRRFAALSVARRVAEERGEELGQNAVGCAEAASDDDQSTCWEEL